MRSTEVFCDRCGVALHPSMVQLVICPSRHEAYCARTTELCAACVRHVLETFAKNWAHQPTYR